MLYMVIERFKNRDAKAVYRRFREKGRMIPDGLAYVESWVEYNFDRCFQLMECDDQRLLEEWADRWRDLVDFEFVPVRRSKEAVETVALDFCITISPANAGSCEGWSARRPVSAGPAHSVL